MKNKTAVIFLVISIVAISIVVYTLFRKPITQQQNNDAKQDQSAQSKQDVAYAQEKIIVKQVENTTVLYTPQDRQNNQWIIQDNATQEEINIVAIKYDINYARTTFPKNDFSEYTANLQGWKSTNTSKIIYLLEDQENQENIWITSELKDENNKETVIKSIESIINNLSIRGKYNT